MRPFRWHENPGGRGRSGVSAEHRIFRGLAQLASRAPQLCIAIVKDEPPGFGMRNDSSAFRGSARPASRSGKGQVRGKAALPRTHSTTLARPPWLRGGASKANAHLRFCQTNPNRSLPSIVSIYYTPISYDINSGKKSCGPKCRLGGGEQYGPGGDKPRSSFLVQTSALVCVFVCRSGFGVRLIGVPLLLRIEVGRPPGGKKAADFSISHWQSGAPLWQDAANTRPNAKALVRAGSAE
jgi:hypothetical protein